MQQKYFIYSRLQWLIIAGILCRWRSHCFDHWASASI